MATLGAEKTVLRASLISSNWKLVLKVVLWGAAKGYDRCAEGKPEALATQRKTSSFNYITVAKDEEEELNQ
jgi:hypothetical protein